MAFLRTRVPHRASVQPTRLLCHDGSWQRIGWAVAREGPSRTYLGEEPPPLPVPQLQVGGAVPLQDLHGCQLLLPLGKGPGGEVHGQGLRAGGQRT